MTMRPSDSDLSTTATQIPAHPDPAADELDGVADAETIRRVRRYDLAALLISVSAGLLAVLLGYYHRVGDYGVETDFYGGYAPQAANILAGRPYTYRTNPPGYSVLLASASLLTGGNFFAAGKLLSAIATTVFGTVAYLLLKSLFDARVAIAATLLTLLAMFPYPFLASTDMVSAATMLVPIWIILRRTQRWPAAALLAGAFSGIAFLVRYNAVVLVPGIAFGLLVLNVTRLDLVRRFQGAGLFFAAFLLTTAPWLLWNWQHYGSPLASTAHAQIGARFFHPAGDLGLGVQESGLKFQSLTDVLLYDPVSLLEQYVKDVAYFYPALLAERGLGFPAYLFAGAGFLFLLRDVTCRRLTYFVLCALAYLQMGLVGFYERYHLSVYPLLFLAVAYFLFHPRLIAVFSGLQFPRTAPSRALFAGIALSLAYHVYDVSTDVIGSEPRHLLAAADWLRARSAHGDTVVAWKPHLPYLAGLPGASIVADNAEDFLAASRKQGARYIVYSSFEAGFWPGLESLRDPAALPDDFRPVYRDEPSGLVIYDIGGR
jgi:hypothetical protein